MTDPQQQPPGSADGVPAAGLLDHDSLTRFLLQDAGVRGVRVHLDATWQQIGSRSESPAAVRELRALGMEFVENAAAHTERR